MQIITTALVAAIMMGGCASVRDTMVYEKPGVSEEQMRADEAACTLAALDSTAPRSSTSTATRSMTACGPAATGY